MMDPTALPQMIQAGGAVALACWVAYELRAFRVELTDHLRSLSEGIAVLLDRTERSE
jgi:hypothetical protein